METEPRDNAGWYRWDGDDLLITLRVQPRASRDEFAGLLGDALKVRVTAPPVEGKANAHLVRFLARAFGVPRNHVTLIRGDNSRTKTFRVNSPDRFPLPVERT